MDKRQVQLEEGSVSLSDNWCRIEHMALLVKRGDYSSLAGLRCQLGVVENEIAVKLNISPQLFGHWEEGAKQPTIYQMARWRVILSGYIDERIKSYLDVDSMEMVNQFWELLWELTE